jgi:hypothetical protein
MSGEKNERAGQVHFPIARIEVAAQLILKLLVRMLSKSDPEIFAVPPGDLSGPFVASRRLR